MRKPLGYLRVKLHQYASMSRRFTSKVKRIYHHTLFIPGCSLASYDPLVLKNLLEDLKRYDPKIQLYVNCCAKPLLDISDDEGYLRQQSNLEQFFRSKGIKEIVVGCSNCFAVYHKAFQNLKVVTLWEIIAKIGVPMTLKNHYLDSKEYAIHDPCPTNKNLKTREHVREIIAELGLPTTEFDQMGKCCGSKGMNHALNPELWTRMSISRVAESPSTHILSYCQNCVFTLSNAGSSALHLLDFLYNPEIISKTADRQKQFSIINSWENRYELTR